MEKLKFKGVTKNIEIEYKPIGENAYACYVNGECAEGFDPDESIVLRVDMADTSDYVAIQNHSPFWCCPFWGKSLSELPKMVQQLLIKREEDYLCIIPTCDSIFKTVIRGCEGGFELCMYTNCEGVTLCEHQLAFVCMEGGDPLALVHDCARAVADALGNGLALREDKKLSEVFEYLGWCSWDALQIRVSHEGLLEKVKEFKEKGVPIHYAIIDDMWADVPRLATVPADASFGDMVRVMHNSPIVSFRGDPKRFPDGMGAAIADMKRMGIPNIGVWFPTTGYWLGFDENGELFEKYKDRLVKLPKEPFRKEKDFYIMKPDAEYLEEFFDDLCASVSEWGGDFVKIDNQGMHTFYRNVAPIGKSARAVQNAIDKATDKHFEGALINCMGMPSECMLNRTSTVSRCSDDFMPESREWFAKNILQCSYNGLLQGQFYVNDWDMWWTDDEQAAKNSLCRAISGGPVYVSDKIGRTNPDVLRPMCLSDGRLLRCDESATPTADCLVCDPTASGRIFKIRNVMGDNGLCAVFNIDAQNREVSGTLAPSETHIADGDYVYYEYFSGESGILRRGEHLDITLKDNDDMRLYTFVPHRADGVTVLGRLDLYMGIGAVESYDGETVVLKEGGEIGLYRDGLIKMITDNNTFSVKDI